MNLSCEKMYVYEFHTCHNLAQYVRFYVSHATIAYPSILDYLENTSMARWTIGF